MEFFQSGPEVRNEFLYNLWFREFLNHLLPQALHASIFRELTEFGERAASELWRLECQAEREVPSHVPYDPWGKRIDQIRVSGAWEALHQVAAREGLVAIGYERAEGEYSRLRQIAKLFLFHPSSAFVSCPLAMTDGAARLLELYGSAEQKQSMFMHLTARNPNQFWTSGQWMTERSGGSDVGGTETIAKHDVDGSFRLYGTKWFSSAISANVAFALARIEGAPSGSRGLSVFAVRIRHEDGSLNGIQVNRLKDKLGTKALPTAELTLAGAKAELVGDPGQGVATIASLFNITRIYNSVCAISTAGRALSLARDYAGKRKAFGKFLNEHPLHVETLAALAAEEAAGLMLTLEVALLLGKEETGKATPAESRLLRLLTPVVKLYTGKLAVAITSECIEAIGGAAYIEDTEIPRLLRNAQVFSIWEGTTNILCLDALRAVVKEDAFSAAAEVLQARLAPITDPALLGYKLAIEQGFGELEEYLLGGSDQRGARDFGLGTAKTFSALFLLDCLAKTRDLQLRQRVELVLRRLIQNGLARFDADKASSSAEARLMLKI